MSQKKKNKSIPTVTTPTTKTLKRVSKKRVVVLEENLVRRSPRMRGKIPKVSAETQSTSPKQSNEEYLVQVVLDDPPNQPKILDIPQNLDEECKDEMNEIQNNSPTS